MKSFLAFILNKRGVVLFILAVLSASHVYSQQITGLIFDDESYSRVKSISPAQNFSSSNEPYVSLRPFCPIPGNQGNIGSCVGWSAAYGAYTTALSKMNNITESYSITSQAYSALFLYNQIKVSDCIGGAYLHIAFEFLKNNGVCKATEFSPENCYIKPDDRVRSLARNNRIKSYYTLFQTDVNPDMKVATTIQELQNGRPVVIGMMLTSSFQLIGSDGLWSPQPYEPSIGAHAMCVVGYDNQVERFEILNSWGTGFGDNGYVYVSYRDYSKYCRNAFSFILEENNPIDPFTFKGSYYVNKLVSYDSETGEYNFNRIDGIRRGDKYELYPGSLKLNSYFRVMASEMADGNALYIFSIKPDGSGELLFPTKRENFFGITLTDDPIILDEGSYIELPPERAFKADQTGDDSLIFLYSKYELQNPDELVQRIANETGDIMTRLTSVLGNKLVPASDIKLADNMMQFYGTSRRGTIVPLVLKVKINP